MEVPGEAAYSPTVVVDLQPLEQLPRCGFLDGPTPVTVLPEGGGVGADWVGVKRDDLIEALHGGSKVRKLDLLLAAPPFADAKGWVSMGAIGSGHLLGLAAAAARLERPLEAHLFDEPWGPHVEENLAALASFAGSEPRTALTFRFAPSRLGLLLRPPWPLLRASTGGGPVIPPGATLPRAMVGTVLGGLELAAQISSGEVARPDRIYLAVGTGGTAVGIALGLGLGGCPIPVHAVAVVERLLLGEGRLAQLERGLREELAGIGLPLEGASFERAPLLLRRGFLGRGYGHVTDASLAACARFAPHGPKLEPVYTGKAAAALLADASAGETERPLLWNTHRGELPPPDPAWRERLPPALRRRLARPGRGRRRFLIAAGAGVTGLLVGQRVACTDPRASFAGATLTAREATIFGAAVRALLPPAPLDDALVDEIVAAADAYVATFPEKRRLEVHGMLFAVEQAPLLEGHLSRCSALEPEVAADYLAALRARPGLLGDAGRGLRDLVLLATYTRPGLWETLGYTGPWEQRPLDAPPPIEARRGPYADYADLVAKAGSRPEGWR